MHPSELQAKLEKQLGIEYFYISRSPYTAKGLPVYNIFFNTRISHSRISTSAIKAQNIFQVSGLINGKFKSFRFERPMLLTEYSRTINPNSMFNFIDLAGEFLASDKG